MHQQELQCCGQDVGRNRHGRDTAWQKQSDGPVAFRITGSLKDICVLIPTRTSLAALEDALDDTGIEYRAGSVVLGVLRRRK